MKKPLTSDELKWISVDFDDVIEDWLDTYDIPFKTIVCGKILVRWMIDDRNIEFKGDWNTVLDKVK